MKKTQTADRPRQERKLTPRQTINRMKKEYELLVDSLVERNERLIDKLAQAEKELEDWHIPEYNKQGWIMTQEEYDNFNILLKEIQKARSLFGEQLYSLCRTADKALDNSAPTADSDRQNPLYWLRKLTDVHFDGNIYWSKKYDNGAFDLIDRIIRQCEYGMNFVYHQRRKDTPNAAAPEEVAT